MTVSDPQSPELVRAEAAARWCMRLCEGQMTNAARAEFVHWLNSDPLHRAAFDQAVATWEEVHAAQAHPELLVLRVEALESLRRAQRARAGRRSPGTRVSWLLGTSVALAILFAIGVRWPLNLGEFSSGIGERRTVPLADGSLVSLDASSEVRVRYSAAQRTLHLVRGRAKFDVAKNAGRPFLVHAADREIVATGTAFSVEIVQKQVRVILYEGQVSVEGLGQRIPLLAGQELIATIALAQTHTEAIDVTHSLSWENGQLEFVREPLASAVERVNRYARNPVSVGDSVAANVPISGVYTAGDTQAFIEGVTAVSPLRAEERNSQVILWSSEHAKD